MNGCRSAYPTKEKAASAAKPILVDRDGEIESFDPNEVMAKAYMTKKPEDDKEEPKSQAQDGPLAFLGLQKKSEEKVDKPVIKKITLEEALSGKAPSPPKEDIVKEKKDDEPDDKSDDKHEKANVMEVDEADESSKTDDNAEKEKLTGQEKSSEDEIKPTEEDKVENDKPEIVEDHSTMEKENDSVQAGETPDTKDDSSQDNEKSDEVTPMET